MGEYTDYSDEELIVLLREGQGDITDFFMEKYKGLVKKKARAMFLIGGENDDLIQEGMIGLFKALRDYKISIDTSFNTFAELCITRQIYSAVQASNRKKHKPLNSYVSLYSEMVTKYEQTVSLQDVLQSITEKNPEEVLIDKESFDIFMMKIKKNLSEYEEQVLELYLDGKGYVEISKELNKTSKSIDNALQRIKGKINNQDVIGC